MDVTSKEYLFELTKAHADTARAAYKSRDAEVTLLQGRIRTLEQAIGDLRAENVVLRSKIRRAGVELITDVLVVR